MSCKNYTLFYANKVCDNNLGFADFSFWENWQVWTKFDLMSLIKYYQIKAGPRYAF